jgi:hypothetical protein
MQDLNFAGLHVTLALAGPASLAEKKTIFS